MSVLSIALCLLGNNSSARSTDGYAPWVGTDFQGRTCTGKYQAYGPYDYLSRSRYRKNLQLVEGAHFNAKVEQLISGAKPNREMEWDLDYTLRAWPNHHRALYTVVRYRGIHGAYKHPNLSPAECYLQRAINFSPKDGTTFMIYGILLQKSGFKSKALDAYRKAQTLSPNDMQVKYNLGLLLFDMGEYDESKELAIKVYRVNFPLKGLKKKLIGAGKLTESELSKQKAQVDNNQS
jgi:tetratricopeptide (TPR) repeat protein